MLYNSFEQLSEAGYAGMRFIIVAHNLPAAAEPHISHSQRGVVGRSASISASRQCCFFSSDGLHHCFMVAIYISAAPPYLRRRRVPHFSTVAIVGDAYFSSLINLAAFLSGSIAAAATNRR